MARNLVETASFSPTHVVVGDLKVFAEPETILSGQTLLQWTVVGRVTASGKWIKCVASANDGSQVPRGITVDAVDASAGDLVGPVYKLGQFNPDLLAMDASWTAAALKAAFAGSGIFLRSPLTL
ncbi:head decoration protein [Labrys wisconsinensis]|uniref:Head decoration protein n=1 Tax=Labrys wisconsinensis TaxID=425677 RepID=A0ABU0JEV6_9HYPH|nr:head decoration protein [Labrys wisconsinensis]MDQ0472810.1 hypothetical protein [Labrys wisconsinensis]